MSATPHNWLCVTTSDTEIENIDEMTCDTWDHFDGICAVVHQQGGGKEVVETLERRKKAGFIIERPYPWHHSHSKNEWLVDRRIGLMDACWIRDSSERLNPDFSKQIAGFTVGLLQNGIWNLAQHSKLLMFRRWFNQQFFNGLHWGLHSPYGNTISMERLGGVFENDINYAYSVRGNKRPADHRYRHEVLYLLDYGANGNHLALFHNDPRDLDAAQHRLYHFINYLTERGVSGVDQFGVWLKSQEKLDDCVKDWINAERPFRNFYRYNVLGHTNEQILTDEDVWRIT